jgi:HD superfamily phosphohydrolase
VHVILNDELWGEVPVEEPVLQELLRTRPVRRLYGIRQAGASVYLFPEKLSNTRYEHSVGVMHLLALLGAGVEERVAGLLHDVPHTAFSHTVDIVFPNDEHNFHERFQHQVVLGSEIPEVLARHGVSLRAALEPHEYPLLEQPLPLLCADRLDYTLRDMFKAGMIAREEALDFVGRLVPTPHGVAVAGATAAEWYARLYNEANRLLWSGPQEAGAYWALAGAIKRAYAIGAFTDEDLFTTDDDAMIKLRAAGDLRVDAYLDLLRPGTVFYEVGDGEVPAFTTNMKLRWVDPPVLEPGWPEPRALSSILPAFAASLPGPGTGRSLPYRLWSDSIGQDVVD